MTIKHIVISGGGPTMFLNMGALEYLQEQKYWMIDDIETIYGTSAGAIVAMILCLKYDWETLNNYFLKRPWQDVFPVNATTIFEAYTKKGLFDKKYLEKAFKPLFSAKELSLEITMKEFYEYSKIEIHLYSFELHEFIPIDISYKSHPDLMLLTALQMSCALPIIFAPHCENGKCYLDGGICTNYPLDDSINAGNNKEEILGFKSKYNGVTDDREKSYIVDEESTMLDYIMSIIHKLVFNMNTESRQQPIPNEVSYNLQYMSFKYLESVLSSQSIRSELKEGGKQAAEDFLEEQKLVSIPNDSCEK